MALKMNLPNNFPSKVKIVLAVNRKYNFDGKRFYFNQ